MKKAIVIDWLDKYGGAERVIESLEEIFCFDESHTLINIMKKEEFNNVFPRNNHKIQQTEVKHLKNKFRILFFLFHFFVKRIKISKDVKLIISSSHAVAKGVNKTNREQIHISYFQARNFNYIWSDYNLYFGNLKYVIHPLIFLLRKIDIYQSKQPDYIISNSIFVQDWVKKIYNRDSIVIYPPVNLSNFNLELQKDDYYVAVGRLVNVKRFDIAIKAFNTLNKKLIIIGDGDQFENLKKLANTNIIFLGFLNSEEVSKYVSKSRGFIQTGIEGFGIAPIEAQACGTPVIAFAEGGVLETVIDLKTGVFFNEQTELSLVNAILIHEKLKYDFFKIRENALRFSKDKFEEKMQHFVAEKIKNHKK